MTNFEKFEDENKKQLNYKFIMVAVENTTVMFEYTITVECIIPLLPLILSTTTTTILPVLQ